MNLAASTKISAIIKANPAAIEAIASISAHFAKLRNPLLRKILASRVSIADAARIGGCQIEDFYRKLAPLGFTMAATAAPEPTPVAVAAKPEFLQQLPIEKITTLDVRESIAAGQDPFRLIMDAVTTLDLTQALLLVNTFEPTPLLTILRKKGFLHFVENLGLELVHTYFWRENAAAPVSGEALTASSESFDALLAAYAGKVRRVDVRHLEMPQPMVTILCELEKLPADAGLYVLHKRVPQYLLPQLQERGFAISIKEAGPGEVYLFIYRK
ncbi:DUF2249 domain-containing protein [Pontibacter akesuensis]|uniref:DUF2249 domain-containing protein n=1 Tax=Pontibacter akesuensis TaxID=388950 RepID=A0A1I7GF39_9BACT|nr:DUF2249 domain-containing protein [Pontibacter akesuensis]GHA57126.1 hypothetical protein GCM10007389_06030 [Pontibacter akesuensis]SFU47069.1 protein of unknown function [Pontibacter akesuensis]